MSDSAQRQRVSDTTVNVPRDLRKVRDAILLAAVEVMARCPDNQERDQALDALDQAAFLAVSSIARME